MVRKDTEKDSDRPHYYSQFWLDIAAGRKTIGASRSGDEADIVEPELDEPVAIRRPTRNSASSSSHHFEEAIVHPEIEPAEEEDEEVEDEEDEEDEEEAILPDETDVGEDEIDEADIPNILVDETVTEAPTGIVEAEIAEEEEEAAEEEDEEDEELLEEEEEEDEEDEDWPGRGRKKPKGRQTRLPTPRTPAPKKGGKRERRPGF